MPSTPCPWKVLFNKCRLCPGAPQLEELYLGDNAMHSVSVEGDGQLLLAPHHVAQLTQFSRLSELELGILVFR